MDRLRWFLAVLSVAAGMIHFLVTPEHFEEYVPFGVFFLLVGAFQIVWGVLVLRSGPTVLVTGLIVNLLVIGVWVLSRTVGVPVGPESGEPEEPGLLDGLATAFEALIVLGVATLLVRANLAHRRATV